MIKVSDIAKEKAVQLMKEDGYDPDTDYIRVGVKSGGCSGLEYVLKFDKERLENDQVFEDNGIKIIVDKKIFPIPRGHHSGVFGRTERKGICLQ